jgi:hypothetical protein
VGKVDDIVMVAVQREARECIDEHEPLTPKRLKRCTKKKMVRRHTNRVHTYQDQVREDVMLPVDYFATSHITR